MTERKPATVKDRVNEKRTLTELVISSTVGRVFSFIGWFLFALVMSILVEWLGMLFLWDTNHSRDVLHKEIQYLSQLDQNFLLSVQPASLATQAVEWVNNGYRWLRVDRALAFLQRHFSLGFIAISSAMDVTYTLIIRLVTVVLALPAFLIWGMLGLIDGLVDRDIRKECGGLESSFLYHHVRRWVAPSLGVGCGLYLTLPFTFNPGLYFLVPQALFFVAVYYTASTFKKFI